MSHYLSESPDLLVLPGPYLLLFSRYQAPLPLGGQGPTQKHMVTMLSPHRTSLFSSMGK